MPDDRESIQPGDRVAADHRGRRRPSRGILLDMARDKGFKGIVATRGESGLRARAALSTPTPSRSTSRCPTWTAGRCSTASSTTRRTRHIPVHIISGDEESARGLQLGAFAHLQKPVTKEALDEAFAKIKRLRRAAEQVAADRRGQRAAAQRDRRADRRRATSRSPRSASGEEALAALRERALRLHGARPRPARHERLRAHRPDEERAATIDDIPIVVYTGRDLTQKEETELKRMAEAIIVKDVALAGAPARRDRALPAPRRGESAGAQAADARAAARVAIRCSPARRR